MGRIKTDMVKRTTVKLMKAHPEKFTKNFEKNKEALKDLAEIRSKKLRNVIAGYSVRLKQQGDELSPRTRKKKDFGAMGRGRGPGGRGPGGPGRGPGGRGPGRR
jgi:small subunit ribosomal protein S17e